MKNMKTDEEREAKQKRNVTVSGAKGNSEIFLSNEVKRTYCTSQRMLRASVDTTPSLESLLICN